MTSRVQGLFWRGLGVVVVLCVGYFSVTTIQWIERVALPVVTDVHVEVAQRDGADLILAGTLIKARDCQRIEGPLAIDGEGKPIHIARPDEPFSRPVMREPQSWGPWRLVGGAQKRVTIYMLHSCHLGWTQGSVLFSFNDALRIEGSTK